MPEPTVSEKTDHVTGGFLAISFRLSRAAFLSCSSPGEIDGFIAILVS